MGEQLAVLLDTGAWDRAADLADTVAALALFIDVYLAQSQEHVVAFYLAPSGKPVWSSTESKRLHFPLTTMSDKIKAALAAAQQPSGLAPALCCALCRLNRLRRGSARVLIATPGGAAGGLHVPLMNAAFCAQKMDVPIDVLRVGGKEAPLLQQAAFLTGGIFQTAERPGDAAHLLLAYYAASGQALRPSIVRPEEADVDFRATCYCHGRSVEQAHVCSVCLSVFCAFSPICPCCRSKFEFPARRK